MSFDPSAAYHTTPDQQHAVNALSADKRFVYGRARKAGYDHAHALRHAKLSPYRKPDTQ